MKKAKTLEVKLRSAIRLIWSRSAERRAILKAATIDDDIFGRAFSCPLCNIKWPLPMAEVDHDPSIGSFTDWHDTVKFIEKMFYGPQRAICKICHKARTAQQRRKAK